MQTKQATAAKTSLVYLTIGALTVVWAVIYYLYLGRTGASDLAYLWCYGFFFSGLVLSIIGLGVGQIGRSAMQADPIPPPTVTVTPAAPTTVVEAPAPTATVVPSVPVAIPAGSLGPSAAAAGTLPTVPVAPVNAAEARR